MRQPVEKLPGGQVLPDTGRVQPVRRPDGQLGVARVRVDRGRGRVTRQPGRAVRVDLQPVPDDCTQVPHVQLGCGRSLHGPLSAADRPDGRTIHRTLFQPRHILAAR